MQSEEGSDMKIKGLSRRKLNKALPLVWDVFSKYEARNYFESGEQAFWNAIHSEEYLDSPTAYGAFEGKELLGIIATRNEGSHIALFFVDGAHQGKGIGRKLWNTVLAENTSKTVTVHSSLFAIPIYNKLGFVQTDDVQDEGGIQYVPMEYQKNIVVYVHGKGGSENEAEHYKQFFKEDVYGFDYKSENPWDAKIEFIDKFKELSDKYNRIILIANSIGAYFSMNSGIEKFIHKAYFISPIVNLERLILNMIEWAGTTEQELEEKK